MTIDKKSELLLELDDKQKQSRSDKLNKKVTDTINNPGYQIMAGIMTIGRNSHQIAKENSHHIGWNYGGVGIGTALVASGIHSLYSNKNKQKVGK